MEIRELEKIYAGRVARLSSEPITPTDVRRRLAEAAEIITGPPVDPAERLRVAVREIEEIGARFEVGELEDVSPYVM
jgi:hypothetical protein